MAQNVPLGFQLLPAALKATPEQFQRFVQGVEAVLSQWTALLLVNHHHDRTAASTIRHDLLRWFFEDGEVYSDELEVYFEDFFSSARYVAVEDGSCKEVADVLHEMYCRCCRDDPSMVEHFQRCLLNYQAVNPVARSVFEGIWEGDADGGRIRIDADDSGGDEDGGPSGLFTCEEHACEESQTVGRLSRSGADDGAEERRKGNAHRGSNNPFKKGADGWCTVQRR